MRIILNNHARLRAIQRDISFEEIVDYILNADHLVDEGDDLVCYKKLGTEYILLWSIRDKMMEISLLSLCGELLK